MISTRLDLVTLLALWVVRRGIDPSNGGAAIDIPSHSSSVGDQDRVIASRAADDLEFRAGVSAIQSAYKEINTLDAEIASLNQGLGQLQQLSEQLITLEKEQAKTKGTSKEIEKKQQRLIILNAQSSQFAIKEEMLNRFAQNASKWAETLADSVLEDFGPDTWDGTPSIRSADLPAFLVLLMRCSYSIGIHIGFWLLMTINTRHCKVVVDAISLNHRTATVAVTLN